MVLLSNTVLSYNDNSYNYEILQSGSILMFKPYFYHVDEGSPCIILTRSDNGWKLQDVLEKQLEEQVMDDVRHLKFVN